MKKFISLLFLLTVIACQGAYKTAETERLHHSLLCGTPLNGRVMCAG